VQIAREFGETFLLLNGDHRLETVFARADWDRFAGVVEHVLGSRLGSSQGGES
jgi:hypothetical protein